MRALIATVSAFLADLERSTKPHQRFDHDPAAPVMAS
jgi:hypothetical protein